MRLLSAIAFLTLFAATFAPDFAVRTAAAEEAARPAPREVDIPSARETLHAQLYKPEGDGPFPVVIGLHGCGGLGRRFQTLPPRFCGLAEQILEGGKGG